MKIDGEYLSHLRFADDILIYANTPYELLQVLHELADESDNQGIMSNKSKTKVMTVTDKTIYVNNNQIENGEIYIYLGQKCNTRDKNPRQGNSKKNHGRVDSIRQAPRHLQG